MIIVKKIPDTMLKNIRLHIEKDEEKQHDLEQKLAKSVLACQSKNINSFARNIPSLLPLVQHPIMQNHSLFCNKFGEINIVDYGIGRTLYGFHPQAEITKQVASFKQHAPYIDLSSQHHTDIVETDEQLETNFESSFGYVVRQSFAPCPDVIECLVILGCGLGMHILELLQSTKIKNLIIYEPETQYFQCSSLVNKWYEIFALAQQQKCQIFIQVQKDGRDIISDISELNEHKKIAGFHLYQHYNHPVFNSLLKELSSKSWSKIKENGITFTPNEHYNHYVPVWTPTINLNKVQSVTNSAPLLTKNLAALQKYFPNIYTEFKDYQPKIWLPVINDLGEINVVKADSLAPWYSDSPKQDCIFNYENFNEQPNKDGLVLGYSGTKLAHYLHYKFVKQTEELLNKAQEETGSLPENIASIIMFGIGVGYQVETLLEHHKVEKLFLCEPNRDFFYASLHAIDWLNIFETIDKTDARIYLNIGDDGSHLFRDLLGQFHSIGPYILNNTYFYQSYYNASLNTAIAQLREQLQIVISMGEYFDHAYYGIAHTKEALGRGYPLLLANPASLLNFDDKDVPIFIVGNGPSLDQSIQAIKEWQHKVIVISCGTALQALYRHGITPDLHAEIEQNRSTYDWAAMIGDLEYLKKITLISCNGIHPDTCELYKDVLIAFKEGESSTVSALSVLGQQNFEVLSHAFPTVSNFVTDLVCKIGFYNIYLLGVDLGFVDVKHHHSKQSGYYQEDGEETYDYAEKNNTSLVVPGNFRPTVNTKHEFKMSRQIIEQVTQKKHKEQTFYNCSDGAKISGTNPLNTDDLLIMATSEQKQEAIKKLYSGVFSALHSQNFVHRFESKFSIKLLSAELKVYEKLLDKEVTNFKQASDLINKQKELLFASYKNGKSLLFYYLYGTVNYANAVLLKLLLNTSDKKAVPTAFNQCLALWCNALVEIKDYLQLENIHFDCSEYSKNDRENFVLTEKTKNSSLLIVTNSSSFANACQLVVKNQLTFIADVTINCLDTFSNARSYDYIIYFSSQTIDRGPLTPTVFGQINTLVIVDEYADKFPVTISERVVTYISAKEMMQNKDVYLNNAILANSTIRVCLNLQPGSVIVPRVNMLKDSKTNFRQIYANCPITRNCTKALVFTYYSSLFENNIAAKHFLGVNGSRGKLITTLDNNIIYVYRQIDKNVMEDADQRYVSLIPNLFDDELFAGCLNKQNI